MPYATIREILSEVDAENPPAPEHFPDFNPTDIEAWAYFIHVYLDSSQSDFGRPSFLPKYTRATGGFQHGFLSQENPFAPRYPANYDEAIKATYIKKILDYIKILTRKWGWVSLKLESVMGFEIKADTDEGWWNFYRALYNRAMSARDVAWRKIMTYCATLIGNQNASNTRIIIPEMAILYSHVKAQWDVVFGEVAGLVLSSGYRTTTQQQNLPPGRRNVETTHATGGTIDIHPDRDSILFAGSDKRFVFLGYLAWLCKVIGHRELGKKPYTIVEITDNRVLHVSYAWLLYVGMEDEYKEILPESVRPYDGELPHNTNTGALLREVQGPNRIDEHWNRFDEENFDLDALENGVDRLDPNGAVSAAWIQGLLRFLENNEDLLLAPDQRRLARININALPTHWVLPEER